MTFDKIQDGGLAEVCALSEFSLLSVQCAAGRNK